MGVVFGQFLVMSRKRAERRVDIREAVGHWQDGDYKEELRMIYTGDSALFRERETERNRRRDEEKKKEEEGENEWL